MVDWIVTGILYFLSMFLFRILGGTAAAGDAIRRWGRAAATREGRSSSSS